ncbi:hypothetical protein V6N13_016836 [Hibiscus sabdariffa]
MGLRPCWFSFLANDGFKFIISIAYPMHPSFAAMCSGVSTNSFSIEANKREKRKELLDSGWTIESQQGIKRQEQKGTQSRSVCDVYIPRLLVDCFWS